MHCHCVTASAPVTGPSPTLLGETSRDPTPEAALARALPRQLPASSTPCLLTG